MKSHIDGSLHENISNSPFPIVKTESSILPIGMLVTRADALAWEFGLRGYDAVHLAAGLLWQESMDEPVTFATFNHKLWQAGSDTGLLCFPEHLRSPDGQRTN